MLPPFVYSVFRLTVYPIFIALITTVTAIVTMDPFKNTTLQYFAIGNIDHEKEQQMRREVTRAKKQAET
ncbi:uncharacterized protein J4E92_008571 [Alternaria infectoria]|uniref:uncharacterized protein n=1 Tax=Alternaria infectoria TaxID=45303 RepID=UPI002220B32C|nr:uncharacterized protein J4E92_008571 [Alternaria infectoria]KAI4920352.1 hypothetical protein J4E92_008571 [Alternaria infectoria]